MSRPAPEMLEQVARALTLMAEILANPKPVTPDLVRMWALVLEDAGITPAEVEPGVAAVLRSERFFPTPADFLKAIDPPENREVLEEAAWQHALRAVRRYGGYASLCAADLGGDRAALWTLDRIGWARLCAELADDNRAIFRAEFLRTYRVARELREGLDYLPGVTEQQNALKGRDLTPALVGRPDWRALPVLDRPRAQPALSGPQPVLRVIEGGKGNLMISAGDLPVGVREEQAE